MYSREHCALATANCALAFELVAPVHAVLDLHPATLPGEAALVQTFRDDPFELVLTDRVPQRVAIVEPNLDTLRRR